jgi:hypothetical protein
MEHLERLSRFGTGATEDTPSNYESGQDLSHSPKTSRIMGRYLAIQIMFTPGWEPAGEQGWADEIARGFWAFWLLWNLVADCRVCLVCFMAGPGVKPRYFPSLATRPC